MVRTAAATVAVAVGGLLFVATLGLAVLLGEAGGDGNDDDHGQPFCTATAQAGGLDVEQTQVAATIVAEGEMAGVPRRGLVVALAAAAVESGVRNLAYGDRDSLGVFQQRPSAGWGSPDELMDVSYAAAAFFGGPGGPNARGAVSEPPGLLDIPRWEQMPVGDAAQAVQRSAFPDRYADRADDAQAWVADLVGASDGCEVALPIERGAYSVTDRFGYREHPITGEWKLHDGLDFAAPTGTPVKSVSPGEVVFVGFRPWAGPHLVEIAHAEGHLSVYGHLTSAVVVAGDLVAAGQPIGTVGSEGMSTGPHLHLTIRRDGELIDPEGWLAGHGVKP